MENLQNQIYLHSLSTDVFLNEEERKLKQYKDRYHDWLRLAKEEDEIIDNIDELHNTLSSAKVKEEKEKLKGYIESSQRQLDYYHWLEDIFKDDKEITKAGIKRDLNNLIEETNKELGDKPRELNKLHLNNSQVISLFESTFTRKMKLESDKLTDKVIIVEIYNYPVFKSLLDNGFTLDGEKFVYYASSSGQIRQKKAVFAHQETLKEIEDSLTNGLTVADVNADGGMSVNKFISYRALTNSASQRWEKFHQENLIDHTIVVDDVEVKIKGRTIDYIDQSYNVNRTNKKPVTIEITDGAGMILPEVEDKPFQFRMPWMKGLICPVPFDEFTDNAKVTDIYGKEWDIEEDQVKLILFKSQFKMWSKFIVDGDKENSWLYFRKNFKKNDCEASFMNVEEDEISDAKTNYQYLQSLVKADDVSLVDLTEKTNGIIANMATDVDTMLEVLGADDANENKNEFQQAINLYPALLNDSNSKEAIKNKKSKLVKEAKAGKLAIDGKFTYVLPDWYGVMQSIFLNKEPTGLLKDGEVYCNLYDEGEVDLLRSPSLSFEHAVRDNVHKEGMEKWYTTKGVYVSSHDLISKVLQMDWDGDQILITPNKTLIKLAKQSREYLDAVPLDYEMGVAAPRIIDSDSIFESLTFAFKGNIGIISNNISKVFNADNFSKDDYETIKQLTAQNNHMIDMAKTLNLPKPPEDVEKKWNSYNDEKLPYFFKFAKDKREDQVVKANNSTVNRLPEFIDNKRLVFKHVVGKFDYKKLLWKPTIKDDAYVIDKATDKAIVKLYKQMDQNKYNYINEEKEDDDRKNKKFYVYQDIRDELLKLHDEPKEVADVLVRHLFTIDSAYKTTLWESFGDEVVAAIRKNVHEEIDCADCKETIHKPRQRQIRCDDCQKGYRRKQKRESERKRRELLKNKTSA